MAWLLSEVKYALLTETLFVPPALFANLSKPMTDVLAHSSSHHGHVQWLLIDCASLTFPIFLLYGCESKQRATGNIHSHGQASFHLLPMPWKEKMLKTNYLRLFSHLELT